MQVPVVARHKNQHTTTSLVSFRQTQDRHLSLFPSHKAIQAGRIFSEGDESHSDEMIGQSPTCQDRHTGTVPSACHMGAALSLSPSSHQNVEYCYFFSTNIKNLTYFCFICLMGSILAEQRERPEEQLNFGCSGKVH